MTLINSLGLFSQSQTDTLQYSHGENVDTYWYSVFKKGDSELMFYNPNMQPYGDRMGHVLDELTELSFIITYKPWAENDSYQIMESINANPKGVLPKVIKFHQPGMDEVNIVFEDINGNRFDLPLKTKYLKFNGEDLIESGAMGRVINSGVYNQMIKNDLFFIGIVGDEVSISNWIH